METVPGYEDAARFEEAATHVRCDGSHASAEAIELRYSTKAAVHLCALYNQATKGKCPCRSLHNPPKETKLETLLFRRWKALTTISSITAKQLFVRMLKIIDPKWNSIQPTMEAVVNVNLSESEVELETTQDKWHNWVTRMWTTDIEKWYFADRPVLTFKDSRSLVEQAIDSQKERIESAIQDFEARQKVNVDPNINSVPSVEDIIRPNLPGDGRSVINVLLEMGGICSIDHCDQWIELPTFGQKPDPRYQHEAFELDYKMCVAGGNNDGLWFDDIQVLDLMRNTCTWSKVDAGTENSRLLLPTDPCSGQQLILWKDELFAIAGQTLKSGSITVKKLDKCSRSWNVVHIEGTKPICRRGHSLTIVGDNFVIFGGEASSGNLLNDLYILNLNTMRWTDFEAKGAAPPPRSGHAAACHEGNFVFIFGGKGQDTYYNDLYKFDVKKFEWTILEPQGLIPAGRAGHAGVTVDSNWIIVGGRDSLAPFSETYVLNMGKVSWSFLASRLSATEGMSLVTSSYDGVDFLISFGGCDGHKGICNNEVHAMRLSKAYDKCETDFWPLNSSDDELSSSEDEATLMFLLESKRKEKREDSVEKKREKRKELFSQRKKDLEALISGRKALQAQALVPKETASPDIVEKEVATPYKFDSPAPYKLDARKRKRLLLESGEADVSNPESLRSI